MVLYLTNKFHKYFLLQYFLTHRSTATMSTFPPFQLTQSAVTGQEGHPDTRTRGDAYKSMGGSIHPRTPMLKRTTHATAHSKALQMHKALPKMTESASPAATNVVALPDPAALGKP